MIDRKPKRIQLRRAMMPPEQKLQVLRAIDKYDRLGAAGVRALLTVGRRDDSGAWMAGAGLTEPQADLILYFLEMRSGSNEDTLAKLRRFFAVMSMSDEQIEQLGVQLANAPIAEKEA